MILCWVLGPGKSRVNKTDEVLEYLASRGEDNLAGIHTYG